MLHVILSNRIIGKVVLSRNKILLALLPTLIAFLVPILVASYVRDEERVFRDLLRGVAVEVDIEGKTYQVSNGSIPDLPEKETRLTVLRLASFYIWTKENPFFYSPDLDLEKLEEHMKQFTEEEEKLLPLLSEEHHFYPVQFLTNFVKTAQVTHDFLENPSDSGALSLIAKQKETTRLYIQEAESLTKLLENAPQTNSTFINIQTSSEIITHDLKKIVKNGKALLKEIEQREACLRGGGACKRPAFTFAKPMAKILSYEEPENLYDASLIYRGEERSKNIAPIRGVYRDATPCFGLSEDLSFPDHFFYLREFENEPYFELSISHVDIKLASDIYFRKIPEDSRIPGDSDLRASGAPYIQQSPTNPYMCPDLGYYTRIVALDHFLKEKKPIIPQTLEKISSAKDFFKEASDVEAYVFSVKHPSYQDLSQLAYYYAYGYTLLTQEGVLDTKTEEFKNELLTRATSIQGGLGNFHLVLGYLTRNLHSFRMIMTLRPKEEDSFFYTFRNYYGLTFFPFSPSVYILDEKPQYVERKRVVGAVGIGGGYLNYQQALERFGEEKMERWFENNSTYVEEELRQRGMLKRVNE